eukprot:CAMPEP_0181290598 /NCGR_PEP_ID=MMETSP1101-20121128/1497_1 /TAXON_ID=46948 /ORGANISM="Rhodomonas abbreviata, Strain Caron Lab Isolate" /LENGTH=148 /DNA_ID=CAMNT_0023394889 /DNA_START=390 /DNA_END=837 /DNA_ORIENTATION=-
MRKKERLSAIYAPSKAVVLLAPLLCCPANCDEYTSLAATTAEKNVTVREPSASCVCCMCFCRSGRSFWFIKTTSSIAALLVTSAPPDLRQPSSDRLQSPLLKRANQTSEQRFVHSPPQSLRRLCVSWYIAMPTPFAMIDRIAPGAKPL